MLYNNIYETIGNTPLIKLNKLGNNIFAKLESCNPSGSIKDRIVLAMILDAKKSGIVNQDTVFIEATSGNTGISLALICSAMGYKSIVVMPENSSEERKLLIKTYGSKVILTPSNEGMLGSVKKVNELLRQNKNYHYLDQFNNKNNVLVHENTTAREIIKDTNGKIDFFVAGYGTGGTITGIGKALKKFNKNIKIIAIEPKTEQDVIPGLGAGFDLKLLDKTIIDETIKISEKDAIDTTKQLLIQEGLFVGISSGAACFAAINIANENKGKNIVVIFPDSGNRYISNNIYEAK